MEKLIVILLLFLYPSNCSDDLERKSQRTALFVTYPFIGHVNPMILQAIELEKRDWKTYIVSCSKLENYVKGFNLSFISIGKCDWMNDFDKLVKDVSQMVTFYTSVDILIRWFIDKYRFIYTDSVKGIQEANLTKIDLAIIDVIARIGPDICDTLNITCIINNPDVLDTLRWLVVPPADYNPLPTSKFHANLKGTNSLQRAILPLLRAYFTLRVLYLHDARLNIIRKEIGLEKSTSSFTSYFRYVILSNTAFGLEYNRPLPTNIFLTGPMLDTNRSRESFINDLSDDDRQWIEYDSKPVIYVNPGTIASFTNEQIDKLVKGLTSDKFRVIWKIPRDHIHPENVSKSIRIVDWLSSTLGHLAHKNVQVFISHCGINSAYESIWLNTPIICLPMFADQYFMANQVEYAGVGIALDKLTFTSDQLASSIDILLQSESYFHNVKRIHAQIHLHGGVKRAADIIETVANFGPEMFLTANYDYPLYVHYNFDVYLIWFLMLCIFGLCLKCIRSVFTRLCRCQTKQKSD